MLILVCVLLRQRAYAEALLYGRRALKGFRKLGLPGIPGIASSLQLLIDVCHADGNGDQEDANMAILSDFLERQEQQASTDFGTYFDEDTTLYKTISKTL